jgi:hypothetical protein
MKGSLLKRLLGRHPCTTGCFPVERRLIGKLIRIRLRNRASWNFTPIREMYGIDWRDKRIPLKSVSSSQEHQGIPPGTNSAASSRP